MDEQPPYDVVIAGGGPAGLQTALMLGRARKRVLLCDAGPRRNAAAVHLHNFVTRDGVPPPEFRRLARAELATYPNVAVRDELVASITGERGAFRVALASDAVTARRIVLCMGMVDEPPALPGFRELWGRSIFQCPYCHGWEVQDRRWGFLAAHPAEPHVLAFALMLRGWTRELCVFTAGADAPPETREQLSRAGVRVETAPLARLVQSAGALEAIELQDGRSVPCEVLFAHPAQRHVALVQALGLALDDDGFVRVDPMKRETSVSGIYAAGDLTTRMQGAIFAASLAAHTAAMLNMELSAELATRGLI
jgi:thioredoxin reductase